MTEALRDEITELSEVIVFGAGFADTNAEAAEGDADWKYRCETDFDSNHKCSAEVSKTK